MKNGLTVGGDYTETRLVGEVKNIAGTVDTEFINAVERLMEEYKVNYVHLFWDRWAFDKGSI